MKKTFAFLFLLSTAFLLFQGCYNDNKQDLLKNSICDTTNTQFTAVIKPIITQNCNSNAGCHGAAPGSVSLENYQSIKDRINDIVIRINSGNMPKGNAKLPDCDIKKIESWVGKGALNN